MSGKTFLCKLILFILVFYLTDYLISTILLKGLEKYYGFNTQPEILINGSSMSYYGLNKIYIESNTGKKVSTYVRGGVGTVDRYYMIQHFLSNYSNNLKSVIYEVNPTLFSEKGISINVHKLFLPFIDQKSLIPYFKERMDLKTFYFYKYIRTKRFDDQLAICSLRGYLKKYDNWQSGILDTINYNQKTESKGSISIENSTDQINIFQKTIEQLNSKKIKVFLVMMPIYHGKIQTYKPESYISFCNYFRTYCSSSTNTFFIDFNSNKSLTDYNNFFDPIHLNTKGQKELSKLVVDVLNDK
jgi:hypothetical protein